MNKNYLSKVVSVCILSSSTYLINSHFGHSVPVDIREFYLLQLFQHFNTYRCGMAIVHTAVLGLALLLVD